MKQPLTMMLMKGAVIGYLPIDQCPGTIERKVGIWTQVYPFKQPARGQIGFNFSKTDNRLLSIEIYYAKLCLSNQYVEFAEYFRDNEAVEIRFDAFSGITTFHFSSDSEGTRMSQTIEVTPPADGIAVIDFMDAKIVCIELIGFDCALETTSDNNPST